MLVNIHVNQFDNFFSREKSFFDTFILYSLIHVLYVLFQGGPFHDVLHSILGAYTCYRPDVGYVSYLPLLSPTSAQLLWGWWKYSK